MSQLNLFSTPDHPERLALACLNLGNAILRARTHLSDRSAADLWGELALLERAVERAIAPPPCVRFRETRPAWATRRAAAPQQPT